MSIRVVSMAAPFRWLSMSLDVGRRHPQALFGGFALLLVVMLLPSAMQLGVQYGLQPGLGGMMAVYALSMLFGLVLMPPLFGGAFRLLHACEAGGTPRATDIVALYRDMPSAVRMVLTALLVMLLYFLAIALLLLVPGGSFIAELFQRALTVPPNAAPTESAAAFAGLVPPPSLLLWMLAAFLILIVLANAYMLAFARAALSERGPLQAVGDGLVASVKNILPMLGIALVLMLAGFVALLLFALVVGVVFAVLAAISPSLAMALMVPLYLALMLLMYVVMFGYYFHAWHDIFGDEVVPPAAVTV